MLSPSILDHLINNDRKLPPEYNLPHTYVEMQVSGWPADGTGWKKTQWVFMWALLLRTNMVLLVMIHCSLVISVILYAHIHSLYNVSTVSSDRCLPVYSVPCGHCGSRLVHRLKPLQVGTCSSVIDLCYTYVMLYLKSPPTSQPLQECWVFHLLAWEDICLLLFS